MQTNRQKNSKNRFISTQTLAYSALLAALSVVLARLIGLMPEESSRFSIESIPIFLAGLFFGPVVGGMVGFTADFVGCLFSAFGYNPIFCVPPILYGVFAGLFRRWISKGSMLPKLIFVWLLPVLFGSILYQSTALSLVYPKGPFTTSMIYFLSTRSIQFAIILVLDVIVSYLLLKSGIFRRLGIWPVPPKHKKAQR
jgi:ECF transporter S component (folate family)